MPNLPLNTTYGDSGASSPLKGFSNVSKLLQQNTRTAASDVTKKSLDSHFNPEDYKSLFGVGKAPAPTNQPDMGIPLSTPVAPQQADSKIEPIPEGYNQYTPVDEKGNWVAPTDQAIVRNWPLALGGGQYLDDPSQPGKMIKSSRFIMDSKLNPGVKQKILGKLSPLLYEMDHIIPLWAGGADTLPNLQIYEKTKNQAKTRIQSVPLTLLANKKITLEEARAMAFDWESKDENGLPSIDEINNKGGFVSLETAEKMSKKWKEDLGKVNTSKYFGEAFKENMAGFSSPKMLGNLKATLGLGPTNTSNLSNKGMPVIGELSKGLVGGSLVGGLTPGTGASPESGTLGTVSNLTGNVLSSIFTLGFIAKGLGKLGLLGKARKAESVLNPFLKYSGTGIKSVDKMLGATKAASVVTKATVLTTDAMKSAGLATDLGNVAKISSKAWAERGARAASTALVLGTWGQLGLAERALTGQEEYTLHNLVKTAANDIVFGGLLGTSGQSVKGYLNVGFWSTMLPLMEGQEIVPALQNGILMTALHGMGYQKGAIDPKLRIGRDEANKMAESTFNDYNGKLFPARTKGVESQEVLTYSPAQLSKIDKARVDFQKNYPDNPVSKHMGPIKTTEDAVYFGEQLARQNFENMVGKGNGTISQEQVEREIQRITVAANQLKTRTLPPEQQVQKNLKDLYSMGEKLRPQIRGDQFKGDEYKLAKNSDEVFKNIDFKKIENARDEQDNMLFEKPTTIVGYGEKLGKEEARIADDMARNPNDYMPYLVGVKDEKTMSIMRYIKHAQEMNPKENGGTSIGNPEATVRWFALEKTPSGVPVPHPVGYSPQAESYSKKYNVNQTPDQINSRLQQTLEAYKNDPEGLQKAINADKAMHVAGTRTPGGSVISLETAKDLAARKAKGEKISEEELFSIIKPSNAQTRYDSNINNETVSKAMVENDSNYIIGNLSKSWMKGGTDVLGTNEGRRKEINPNNPFIEIEGMWIPGAKRAAPVVEKTPMNEGVTKLLGMGNAETSRQEARALSSTAGQILDKVSKPIPETPVSKADLAPKLTLEAPKAPETTKIPPTPEMKPVETNLKGEALPKNDEPVPPEFKLFKKEKALSPADIRSEIDGVNKAAVKLVDKKLKGMDSESEEAQGLIKFRDSFTREKIDAGAKESYKQSEGDEAKGAELFIKRISDAFTSKGLEDPTQGFKNAQSYKKVFRDAVYNKPVLTFTADNNGGLEIKTSGSKEPLSYVERTLGKKTVYYEENKNTEKKKAPTEEDKQKFLLEKGFVPFYYDNKPGSLLGVEFDSAMAGGKKITDKGALDDFTNAMVEKLGFKRGQDTLNSFAKRLKSLNSREQVSPIKGETWKTFVIKGDAGINKTVAETTPNWNEIKVNDVVVNKEKAKNDLGKKKSTDGSMYTSPENIKRMAEGAGFIHTPEWIKPTQSFIDPKTGNLFHQKLEMRAWTEGEKAQFEAGLGRKLNPNDLVTFEDNVKVGYGKVGKDNGKYWEVDSPSESISFKYNEPHETGGSVSLGGIMTKIPAESGVGEALGKHYKTYAENLKTLTKELQNSSGAADIEKIWKNHPEFYKDHWMENLYGELKKSAEHGAGLTQLGQTLNKEINKIVKEEYLGGRFMNGDNLHIKPDWKVKLDPKTGEPTYLNSGEVMISKDTFISLYGKEAYKELQNGKDFDVLAYRYPTLKDTSVAKMKVLIAEENGQKLGNSQVVTNSADTMKFDHDTDGDTLQLFAIGGKKGVPQEMADYFGKKQSEGDMIFPDLEKTAKIPFDGKDTHAKLMKYSEQTLKGGEAIGIAASSVRPLRFMKANDYTMKVGPASEDGVDGTRTVEHLLNGKVFRTEEIPESVNGKKQFSKSPKGAFEVKPTFSDKESYLIGQIGQEAVDSVGTTDLVKRFSNHGGDASSYITEKLFSNAQDKVIKNTLRRVTADFQVPYKLDADSVTKIKPYLETLKKVKANGGKLGPVEEIMLNLDGLKKIDYHYENPEAQKTINKFATENVAKMFEKEATQAPSPVLQKWISIVNKIKNDIPKTVERKKAVLKEWNNFKKSNNISAKDKQEISIWASLSPSANLAYGKYTVRPTFLINESPNVAKSYFEGENKFKKEEPKQDGQGGLISDTWGNIKNTLGMGAKPVTAAVPTTTPKISLDTKKFLESIAANETSVVRGDKYASSQKSGLPQLGDAIGKYRVTEGELKSYSQRYLGKPVTGKEFIASPVMQDNYMTNKANYLANLGYTPPQIADIHNKGMKNSSEPGSEVYQNPDYVKKFLLNYNAKKTPKI